MKISVFGMGYVGTVTAACLADQRHEVVGVDVNELLVSMVERQLKDGTVFVFGYHGKLQEAMQILTDADVTVPEVLVAPQVGPADSSTLADIPLAPPAGPGDSSTLADIPLSPPPEPDEFPTSPHAAIRP